MTRSSFAALAACLLLPAAAAAQNRRPLDWDDFYRIETPGQVAISPDGRQVAFVRTSLVEEENRTHSEVWLVATDGSGAPTRLTSPSTDASSPRWSPDGRLLAFTSRRVLPGASGAASTWFLRMDAPGEAFQIDGVDGPPRFDPTGHWIALLRPVPPDGPRPTPPVLTTEAERKIADRFDGRIFDWMGYRFDRRGYLPDPGDPWATPPEEIILVPAGGGVPRQLTRSRASVSSPAWRLDGAALAYVADTHERDEHTYERADLWTVSLDGTVTRLTDDEYDYGAPAWSPDGKRIAVVGGEGLDVVIREKWDHGAPTDIFVFTADGKERRNATKDWDFIPDSPEWSPDGQWIYFTADMAGNAHLFRVHPEGGSVQQVTFGEGRVSPVSFSTDHTRFAYAMQTPTDPGNVYVSSPDAEDATRLTELNADLRTDLALSSPEEVTFTSADGTEVQGWVLPPVGYTLEDGRRWPMILDVHGGPHGSYGNEFSFERQLQAARGYFVLYTNPRGSTGYGEKFLWGTWGSWGDEDYDDVMAGVDHVLGHYPVDPMRMAVAGYSYGGFMTNWIITQTHRFAAAVSGAGISDWVSDYGTADIPRTKESEFFGPPWEKEGLEHLLASSPIVHAKGVTTPTLFVNGEYDARVPIEEAEQMYTALQKQGVPAKMVRYPQTYHGGWTPWRTLHRYWVSMQWVDRWLEGKQAS
jgi:dipeptidyl aminopeptidase/acylaminoacyl peptidase